MYLRFVVGTISRASGVREGIFAAAYALMREHDLPTTDRERLQSLLTWFSQNLDTPDRFNRTRSKGYYRRTTKGIAWFKASSSRHIGKAYELVELLGQHGYQVETVKSARPGYVVYEDPFQVIAEPFRETYT